MMPERDDHMLAAEYVLGVLPMAERGQFKVRLANSAALRTHVHYWEEHFISIADQIQPVDAPRHVF